MKQIRRVLFCCALGTAVLLGGLGTIVAQSSSAPGGPNTTVSAKALEQQFFDAIRNGDAQKVLSYVSKGGVNVGPEAQHTSQDEVEQQFRSHRGLYCKLFDSSCIQAPINLENSSSACSYRELLTHSEKVRTAASEMTRNGVRQAVLVARVKNDKCPNQNLIDVVFNLEADEWKLFSIP
jgi:hypothetical protein